MNRAEKMAKAREALGGFVIVGWDEPDDVMTAEEFRALLSEAIAPMTCGTCEYANPRLSASENIPVYCTLLGREFYDTFGCLTHKPKEETT